MKKYRYFLLLFLLFGAAVPGWYLLKSQIPDRMQVTKESGSERLLVNMMPGWLCEETVEVGNSGESDIPAENLTLTEPGSYTVTCSLLGVLPIKEVQVDVVERERIIPGGIPVGIYMKTEGVLIVGTGEVCALDGTKQEPVGEIVRSGDYILEVNGIPVSEKEEVVEQISQAVDSKVKLKILRDGEEQELLVPVVQTGKEEYKAGIWIRDDTQGIGTLTYMTEDGDFGALGHGISDIDTSTLLSLKKGNLYETEIRSIVKGENGVPGELSGVIRYQNDHILGTIKRNTEIGIFGTLTTVPDSLDSTETMEIAYKQEVQEGKAYILTALDGETQQYEIEIEKVNLNSSDANKSMVIRVTDPKLLELTGGIVQGMSGSPIIQNGRIVGAVTHVFVNDPTKGYGIFVETMLERVE